MEKKDSDVRTSNYVDLLIMFYDNEEDEEKRHRFTALLNDSVKNFYIAGKEYEHEMWSRAMREYTDLIKRRS